MKGMTIKEVAKMLTLSRGYVATLCNAGKIPHIRLGRRIIIDRDDLEKWIKEHKIGS